MARAPLRIGAFLRLEAYHTHGLLRGLAQFAREHPGVEVLKLPQPRRLSAPAIRELRLSGLIARVTNRADESTLCRLGIPAVNVSGEFATPRLAWVNTDDDQVGRLAWAHLADRGYKHVGYVGNRTHLASLRRRASLLAASQIAGASFAELELAREQEATPFPGPIRRRLARWLRSLPRPIGVLGFNDRVALELAEACRLARLRVPEDVAIIGVGNDLTRLEFAPTEITSIELPTQQIGYAAASWAHDMVRNGRTVPGERRLAPKLVTRRSTDAFAIDDDALTRALDYIRRNRGNTIYIDDVARAAGVSRRVLEKRFRSQLSTSAYALVQRAHLDRAQELLADPQLTLAEVAYGSGYESPQHLHVAFRRFLKCTPGSLRNRLQAG